MYPTKEEAREAFRTLLTVRLARSHLTCLTLRSIMPPLTMLCSLSNSTHTERVHCMWTHCVHFTVFFCRQISLFFFLG